MDKKKKNFIMKRNKIVLAIICFLLLNSTIGRLSNGQNILDVLMGSLVAIITALTLTVLILKKINPTVGMYIGTIGMAVDLSLVSYHVGVYSLVFASIICTSLYQNWKLLLPIIIINIGTFIVSIDKFHFTVDQLSVMINSLIIIIVTVFVTVITAEKTRRENYENEQEAIGLKEQAETLLKESILSEQKLRMFNNELNDSLQQIKFSSEEITKSIDEISTASESQSDNISQMNQSFEKIYSVVKKVSEISKDLRQFSKENDENYVTGEKRIKDLTEQISKFNDLILFTNISMTELNNRNQNISGILETLNRISSQTELLSLNAAIEAARAGVHGKGFNVVANEVKKLAEHSKSSSEEISKNLKEIQTNSLQVLNQVKEGLHIANESKNLLNDVNKSFRNVSISTHNITKKSQTNEEEIVELQKYHHDIMSEIDYLFSTAEEITSSIEEVLSNVKNQDENLELIVTNFDKLKR